METEDLHSIYLARGNEILSGRDVRANAGDGEERGALHQRLHPSSASGGVSYSPEAVSCVVCGIIVPAGNVEVRFPSFE